uniref:Mannosyltransferase n=1 Tax=Pyramimonas obovata TaxID=1411642 RepID=A0A7S0QX74_9CHLO
MALGGGARGRGSEGASLALALTLIALCLRFCGHSMPPALDEDLDGDGGSSSGPGLFSRWGMFSLPSSTLNAFLSRLGEFGEEGLLVTVGPLVVACSAVQRRAV